MGWGIFNPFCECCGTGPCCTDLNQYLNGDSFSNNYSKSSATPGSFLVENLSVTIPSARVVSGGVSTTCVLGIQINKSLTVQLSVPSLCGITPTMSIPITWDPANNWWLGSSNVFPLQTNTHGYSVWCRLTCCGTDNHFRMQMWLTDSGGTVLSVSKPTTETYTGFSLAGQDFTCAALTYNDPDITGHIQPFTEWWGSGMDVAPRFWRPVNSYLLTVSGVANDLCSSCTTMNGSFVLPYDTCTINSATAGYAYCLNSPICPVTSDGHAGCSSTAGIAGWNLTCDSSGNVVVNYIAKSGASFAFFFNFAIATGSFKPYDTNTLSNAGVPALSGACATHYPDLPNQCTWPGTVTVAWAS